MEQLVHEIEEKMAAFLHNTAKLKKRISNKAAARRARKISIDLEKKMKTFRVMSVKAAKK